MNIRVKSFDQAMLPLRVVSYAAGLRMFPNLQGRLRCSLSLFYVLCLLCLFCGASHKLLFRQMLNFYTTGNVMKLENAMIEFQVYMNCFTVILSTLLGWFYSKTYLSLRKRIAKVDKCLQQLGTPMKYDILVMRVWAGLCMCVFNLALLSGTSVNWLMVHFDTLVSFYIAGSYSYGMNVGTIALLDFTCCVGWIKTRQEQMNELLIAHFGAQSLPEPARKSGTFAFATKGRLIQPELLTRGKAWTKHTSQPRIAVSGNFASDSQKPEVLKKLHFLRTMRQVHLDLSIASKMTYTVFGGQVALEMGLALMFIIGCLYYVYLASNSDGTVVPNAFEFALASTMQSGMFFIKIWFVCWVCEHNMRETTKVSEIIHAIREPLNDLDLKEELHQFALQISQSRFTLAMYGFYYLNYSFIRQCINSVATYVVIMIQMGVTLQSKDT